MAKKQTPKAKAKQGVPPREHRFTSENQPSPEAKSLGKQRAKARAKVMEELKKEFLATSIIMVNNGKKEEITALDAGIKKIVHTYINKPDKMLKVLELISKFERDDTLDALKIQESKEKRGQYDEQFNDSFIDALNAKAEEIWKE